VCFFCSGGEEKGLCFRRPAAFGDERLNNPVHPQPRSHPNPPTPLRRQQDVRAATGASGGGGTDSVTGGTALFDAFRPGDVVRAAVLSLGDARSYFLTTAANELGVVHATSLAGNVMVPASWEAMVDPVTQCQEKRKVARVAGAVPAAK
jgi:hypothetical protein